jgi:Fe-S oxidoreductase
MKKEALSPELLKCTLCKACRIVCPVKIDLPFVMYRAKLLEKFQTLSKHLYLEIKMP